uniref:Uncharacterized protein n=1 Tax=Romanomermis culicivorax TaxID=13658 RepID=A0A915L668_ROMCU
MPTESLDESTGGLLMPHSMSFKHPKDRWCLLRNSGCSETIAKGQLAIVGTPIDNLVAVVGQ